jgi:hypothetical protein
LLAGDLCALRLSDGERAFDVPAGFAEVAQVALNARKVRQRRRCAAAITHLLQDG